MRSRRRSAEPAAVPGEPAPAPAEAEAVEPDDSDVGAGASLGVWVTGLLVAVLILLAVFAL